MSVDRGDVSNKKIPKYSQPAVDITEYDMEEEAEPIDYMTEQPVDDETSGGCCCRCGGLMPSLEYSMPTQMNSGVEDQLAYAIGNTAIDGNTKQNRMVERAGGQKMKNKRMMNNGDYMNSGGARVGGMKMKKELSEGLRKYQRNVNKLIQAGYTRKEAQSLLKEMKGDGFFSDLFDGVKDVASVVAPFVPLLI
jgi:hypothetical protein